MKASLLSRILAACLQLQAVHAFSLLSSSSSSSSSLLTLSQSTSSDTETSSRTTASTETVFQDFVEFLKAKQIEIIAELESLDTHGAKFTNDAWGAFAQEDSTSKTSNSTGSGGLTRVLQGGSIIEKGACSLTVIRKGVLSEDRAATISARTQQEDMTISAGDIYSAAALSIVFHTQSPLVPTFRSDIRIFMIQQTDGSTVAWFGGGADLTPYYLFDQDIRNFHVLYRDLCERHLSDSSEFTYARMKQACDDYFYLPARAEHRGTGGIFFDDMMATNETLAFVKGVADTWMPSWLPIVYQRSGTDYTKQQKQWQLLRRGRYLEFNLLYDRGVKFGLANENPRVEGVMVSAPPMIAFEYKHEVETGSPEAKLCEVLKHPRDWLS